MLDAMPEYERHNRYLFASIGYAVIVLEVLHMFYQPVAHINRLQPLMRKALRAYICGESAAVNGDGTPYDEQIAAVDELVRTMESQYDRLVDMNGKEVADRRLAATRAAANSLRLLKRSSNRNSHVRGEEERLRRRPSRQRPQGAAESQSVIPTPPRRGHR